MNIEVGSVWVNDKDMSINLIVTGVEENEGFSRVRYKKYSDIFCIGIDNCRKDEFLIKNTPKINNEKSSNNNKEYNRGFKEGYNTGYNKGSEYGEVVKGQEIENILKAEAWKEVYDQCICDLIEEGVLEDINEEYSEYRFGDVEDDEEEYCFAKELKNILNGERHIILDGKLLRGKEAKDMQESLAESLSRSEEYKEGYKDGKERGVTIGFNKRDYAINKSIGSSVGSERKHSHYFKDVRHLDYVDIYQVCKLFEVEDSSHCTQHSIKKLLMSGKRGAKDKIKDITEARDTLSRYLQIEGYE